MTGKNITMSRTKAAGPPKPVEQNTAAKMKALVTKVYCTLCTRTVDAAVTVSPSVVGKRRWGVQPGQRCQHCGASLDAAFVLGNMS